MAKREQDPVGALRRKVRKDKGIQHMPEVQVSALKEQHKEHPTWAYKLHHDNLVVTAEVEQLGAVGCYTTSLRTMKAKGLLRQRRRGAEGSRA